MVHLRSAAASLALSNLAYALGTPDSCPTNGQLSCHNTSVVADTCCFNAPGGSLLQTQFWDTNPATGPEESFTIHGLWPDLCDGSYEATCDPNRQYTNITQILQQFGYNDLLNYMQTYWVSDSGTNEAFWEHEWGKHGTCISTLDTDCYENYTPSITPSSSQTYSLSSVQSALAAGHGNYAPYVGCTSGALTEVWYYYNVRGSVQSGQFVPAEALGSTTNCPSTISYKPKTSSTATTMSTATKATATATPTGPTFSGKGYLNVIDKGSQNGCIISKGTWYTTGTCATFTTAAVSGGFTLQGSKGYCSVKSDGSLDCTASSGSVFGSSGSKLTYQSSSSFYAQAAASGSTQQTVYTMSQSEPLTIQWQGQ